MEKIKRINLLLKSVFKKTDEFENFHRMPLNPLKGTRPAISRLIPLGNKRARVGKANIAVYLYTLIIILIAISFNLNAQVSPGKYLVEFTDKDNSSYSIDLSEEFLSPRAIDRRSKQNIEITVEDVPVSIFYLDSLKKLNLAIVSKSKWFNSIVISTTDTALLDTLENISFVKKLHRNLKSTTVKSTKDKFHSDLLRNNLVSFIETSNASYEYGFGLNQIEMLNGNLLHEMGFAGEGMQIAIIDAGFLNANTLNAFDSAWANNQILGGWDFVDNTLIDFTKHYHGSAVFSTIAANIPEFLVGTAPKASYWLLRSEDVNSEFRIEEEYWIAAAEFADSAGADVLNTSLGYSTFDYSWQNYSNDDLDGKTARISIASTIAASKGMIVVTSAGNSGNDVNWNFQITAPADADSVITVGAVDPGGNYVSFSSQGPTVDGRVKPNVVAQGYETAVQITDEEIVLGSGTSFSAPIIAGMVACLWQAVPNATNIEIVETIEKSASQYNQPDEYMGFGIPDFFAALNLLKIQHANFDLSDIISVYPTIFKDFIKIDFYSDTNQNINLRITDINGRDYYNMEILLSAQEVYSHIFTEVNKFANGVYFVIVYTENNSYSRLIIKQ